MLEKLKIPVIKIEVGECLAFSLDSKKNEQYLSKSLFFNMSYHTFINYYSLVFIIYPTSIKKPKFENRLGGKSILNRGSYMNINVNVTT